MHRSYAFGKGGKKAREWERKRRKEKETGVSKRERKGRKRN
jgi:hypothetical protein